MSRQTKRTWCVSIAGFFLAVLFLFTIQAFAQIDPPGIPASLDGQVGLLPTILVAWQSGKHLVAGAGLLMVLMVAFRVFALPKLSISSKAIPVISLLLGIAYAILVGVYGGAAPAAAVMAVLSGPLSNGLWSAAVKYLLPELPS